MLTKLLARNFKRFGQLEIELGSNVVFVGPNNSGKTSALQALALWEIGLRRWNEKRAGKEAPEKRPGVTINRRDVISVPVPDAKLLWRDLYVRNVQKVDGKPLGRLVSELLLEALARRREGASMKADFKWIAKPMKARIDILDKDQLLDILDRNTAR